MFLNKKSICITLVMVIFACVCISVVSANTNITSDSQDNVTDLENNSVDLVKEPERNLTIWDICDPLYKPERLSIGPCDIYDQVKKILSEKNTNITSDNSQDNVTDLEIKDVKTRKFVPLGISIDLARDLSDIPQRIDGIKPRGGEGSYLPKDSTPAPAPFVNYTDTYFKDVETGKFVPLGEVTKPLPSNMVILFEDSTIGNFEELHNGVGLTYEDIMFGDEHEHSLVNYANKYPNYTDTYGIDYDTGKFVPLGEITKPLPENMVMYKDKVDHNGWGLTYEDIMNHNYQTHPLK